MPVSVRGWAGVAPGVTESARRYIAQVALSLRPSTVAHIEHDLREFGTWLAEFRPEVASCADLARPHLEQFKTWLAGRRGLRTGKQPRQLPATDEGHEMRRLRAEMHRRMLGNGYCARPVEMDCHFDSSCEGCTFFVTTIAFRPTLQQQRDDAERKGQVARQKIFDGLLTRLNDQQAG